VTKHDREGNERRGRRREGRGLVAVLLGTALLAVLGFGLGIVAGLVFEEPGLLFDYVTGKTQPAPLDATRSANEFAAAERERASIPDAVIAPPVEPVAEVAAAKPQDGGAAPRAFEAAAAEATPPQVAAAPPGMPERKVDPPAEALADEEPALTPPAPSTRSGYSVQVGALADAASAEQLALKLRKRGFPVYVAPSAEPGSKRWRVRVGPVATREEADELATKLEREKLPTWILAEGSR
jgi:DedD protein